tara:strand:+ start:3408 stop:3788 length:381 start_codon:yes stop_codon:yes gene_type:complete
MTTRLGTAKCESTQKSFTQKKIEQKLEGYTRLKNNKFKTLEPGDNIRYSINGEFRGGGRVKMVKFPEYLICMNVIKNVSWSVQLKDPTIMIWVKTKTSMDEERKEMANVYKMYKAGNLVKPSKSRK